MRAERRSSATAPPDVLARHAEEIDGLTMQVASLKVYELASCLFYLLDSCGCACRLALL